jgi:3-dehydroquinate synthase
MNKAIIQQAISNHKTSIWAGRDVLDSFPPECRYTRAIVVLDEVVAALHTERLQRVFSALAREFQVIELQAGEASKTLDNAVRLINELIALNLTKTDCLLAVGGGTITDLTGFMAQLVYRGVPLILLPTTLLAQVDAAVGGKNGVNLNGKKNQIGGFYFPELVICDTSFLDTLPTRQIQSGMAEVIKVLGVRDTRAFFDLEAHQGLSLFVDQDRRNSLIARSIKAKVDLLATDPFEECPQRLLNFGHTFAHFIEEQSNFGLTHGEAVMLSMLCEVKMAHLAGFCTSDVFETLWNVIFANMSEECWDFDLPSNKFIEAILATRRLRGGHDHLVVLAGDGPASIVPDVSSALAVAAWEALSCGDKKRGRVNA